MSTKKPLTKRVYFTVYASGLAAHIVRPEDRYVDAVACSSLPPTGGRAESHAHHHRSGLISFDSARTLTEGAFILPEGGPIDDPESDAYPAQSLVEVSVEGFRIEAPRDPAAPGSLERTLKMEHLTLEMRSHIEGSNPNMFKSLRIAFDGVSVDGHSLIVETDPKLFLDDGAKQTLDQTATSSPAPEKRSNQIIYQGKGITFGTVVTGLRWKDGAPEKTEISGNRLSITGLGSLYFGEILVEEGSRRLSLVRLQLGCVNTGSGTVGDAGSKINWVPPE